MDDSDSVEYGLDWILCFFCFKLKPLEGGEFLPDDDWICKDCLGESKKAKLSEA